MKLRAFLPTLLATAALALADDVQRVSPEHAAKLVATGKAVLVDVREPAEWADGGVAAPAVLLPMSDFKGAQKEWKPFLEKNAGKELILYCRSGGRSMAVAEELAKKGVKTSNVGSFREWVTAGLPVRKVEEKK
ncbi:MAG: rhodanese-like domain-containing protein [Verrucomicrobia bacterium]|nr:rhodanese-like domain-containing protein [Verrucomicrobiota bacterium]